MTHKKEFEVNAMSGKLEYRDKETRLKLNVLISSSGFTPQSGELLSGKTAGRLEISIKKMDIEKMIEA
jgi:predicted DNA-binding protein with PD1-like motif